MKIHVLAALAALAGLSAGLVHAQSQPASPAGGAFPNRPMRIIVPFTPGGGNDVFGRAVAQKMQERLGQPVVVENKPGAGGNIGAEFVAKSPGDGYTMLVAQNGLTMVPWLSKSLPFDVNKDLAPIGIGVSLPMVAVVTNNLPINSIQDLVAYAKANPGKLSYATPGVGTPHHLSMEWFMDLTGTKMVQVPYKGAAGMLTDLIAGQVHVMFGALNSAMSHIQAGKIRALALAEARRNPILNVPTVNETIPGYEVTFWFGLSAPGTTPEALLNRLSDEQRAIVNSPDVRERLAGVGFVPTPTTSAEMRKLMQVEYERWGKVVKSVGIKPE